MIDYIKKKDRLSLHLKQISTNIWQAEVAVEASLINSIYKQTLKAFQRDTILPGFKKETIPLSYLEENYKSSVTNNIKNYLFKHFILDFLMDEIRNEKITLTNYPRLTNAFIEKNKEATFTFDISVATPLLLKEWKYFIFRAPKRKRYKDLDKQVCIFLKKELTIFKKRNQNEIEEGDWIFFHCELVDNSDQLITNLNKSSFWIKINNKYVKKPFQESLLGKKTGDTFITNKLYWQNEFCPDEESNRYSYKITIKKIAKGNNFYLESFRSAFKLKSKTEVHNKLIEVFSFRNDTSQRKAIIEEVFHLLLSKHRFEIPKHFSVRRQEEIISYLKKRPDYNVYKQNEDFAQQISMLAEKQLKEEILIDQLAYKENISVSSEDLKNYLYFFNNNRLKEFIYFKPIIEKIEESDFPLQTGMLKQYALREKALNEIIYELTR